MNRLILLGPLLALSREHRTAPADAGARGRVAPGRVGLAHRAFAALAASLVGSDAPPETLPLLAALLSIPPEAGYQMPPLSPQRLHAATQNAVLSWLGAQARTSPTILVIEDLHWADPTTLALLATALKLPPIPGLLTVATARPDLRRNAEEWLTGLASSPRYDRW